MSSPRRHTRKLSVAAALLAVVLVVATACQPPPPPPQTFTIGGGGWGHGVGMSQFGAKAMADAGHSAAQILTTYYSGTQVVTRTPAAQVRVAVAERQSTMTFTAGGPTTFDGVGSIAAGQTVTVTRDGAGIRLSGALNAASPGLSVRFAGAGGVIKLAETGNGYRYGVIEVRADNAGGVRAVVAGLTMQQYLYGLAEMPASWHAEALRAQAIAARTYAQKRLDSRVGSGLDYDLVATVYDQVYAGTRNEHTRWNAAVDATNAQFVIYNGALVDAVYSSSNGGHTETALYVWGGQVPYLAARPDPFDQNPANPYGAWSRTYTGTQLGAWFGVGTVTSISISGNVGPSGRKDRATVRVVGTTGTATVTGAKFRSTINANNPTDRNNQILSTNYAVK